MVVYIHRWGGMLEDGRNGMFALSEVLSLWWAYS